MKRIVAILLAVCLLLSLAACAASKDAEADDGKLHITFKVTHDDGTEKEFQIATDAKTLGEALVAEKLVVESAESAGMYNEVDGEVADWNDNEGWWCFSVNGEVLTVGIDQQELVDGATYEAVFTHGFEG